MIQIRLIRNDDGSQDDTINIRRRHHHSDFLIRYVDGTLPKSVWVNEKTRDEVVEYIHQTLYFAMHDACPFKSVQVAVPGCPIFLLHHNALTHHSISVIVRACEVWLDSPGAIFTQ
jgi:hypothetical protein